MRTHALVTSLLVLIAFGLPAKRTDAADAERPNIVFIFADDHAYQAIGAYGGYLKDVVRTPNLDKLAREGMLFRRCFVTNSICGPMRAVIQTGKYSHINGFLTNGNKFNGNQQTFPKLLQKAGYQTAVIGKWHLGTHQAPQGYDYSEVLIGQGPYYNPTMLKDADGSGVNEKRTKEKHVGYVSDIVTDLTLNWLKNGRDKTKPFMLMCQHKAPHRAWDPLPEQYAKYKGVRIPEPETLFEEYTEQVKARGMNTMTIARHMRDGYDLKRSNWAPNNLNPTQKEAYLAAFADENAEYEKNKSRMTADEDTRWAHQRYAKIYLSCIASVDENVGRVLAYLEETGLDENTIVIYTSDQGFYLGEHGWYDKRWVYEESLKTPMIVRWPGQVKAGTENSDIVSPLDFAETFLDIAVVDVPGDMQGRSLVPVFKGNTPKDWRKSHYYQYYEGGGHGVRKHYAVCTKQHKLIHFYEKGLDQWELIDLKADPLEKKNFYDNTKYAKVQKQLHEELTILRSKYQLN
jgi:arylsulfatase A-like enzyme